ncbi:hypothetical protein [Cesiribacter sp. SM1]|uniref:hypothetical protein n=1 Tax=Cesiribacter sp. SM1 TaxID=2861196 RepID=UPI001CD6B175|nr:hypothetical protein [Cesiribacter sp. SM1]
MKTMYAMYGTIFLMLMLGLPLSVWSQSLPAMEAKKDQLLEKRYATCLLALREKDDAKTLTMLQAMAEEYIAEMEKFKPAYEKWYRSLSLEESTELLEQINNKKWILLMQELQFDEEIFKRFIKNPELKQEYENIQFQCDLASRMDLLIE